MTHYWTNAMGGTAYIPGTTWPVAACDYVLCGVGLVDGFPDLFQLGDSDYEGDTSSLETKDVTCPTCVYLLKVENAHRLKASERRALARSRPAGS